MKKRHVFATPDIVTAEAVLREERRLGVARDSICPEARSDTETERIDDDELNVSMDIIPAAWHGTIYGAGAGPAAVLAAMFVPFFGVSLAGAGVLAVVGGRVGTWASVLMGSALPDEVRCTFGAEIQAGQVLVVIDAEPEQFAAIEPGRCRGRAAAFRVDHGVELLSAIASSLPGAVTMRAPPT